MGWKNVCEWMRTVASGKLLTVGRVGVKVPVCGSFAPVPKEF